MIKTDGSNQLQHESIDALQHPILSQLENDLYRLGEEGNAKYAKDWSETPAVTPPVVFLPAKTQDVSRILSLCYEHNQSVVTQGGLTGLSGGATPQHNEWALSLERLQSIAELDEQSMTIRVGAGVTLQTIHEKAAEAELVFPLDLGARGSCTAGGITSTNAGGNQVIQRGMARALVLGLEAVLADGTIMSNHNKLLKNNAGFDLKQLFIGTEGTLGVVTEITFRLFPQRPVVQTALCAFANFNDVIGFLKDAQRNILALKAFEVMWAEYFSAATEASSNRDPFAETYDYYVLCEAEGVDAEAAAQEFEMALSEGIEKGLIQDAVIAKSARETQELWEVRDAVTELLPTLKPVANFDVGIPIPEMENFSAAVEKQLKDTFPGCTTLFFGHIGDGNVHLIASTGSDGDVEAIEEIVFAHARAVNGTITAEHGIGVHKKQWLSYSRNDSELALMRMLKRTLDPKNILNPGRVIDV